MSEAVFYSSPRGDWRLAAALIGAVLGAGFATGREVLQFFALHGRHGYLGMILATGLFCLLVGGLTSEHACNRFQTYGELYRQLGGPVLGPLLDWATTIFLFLGFALTLSALAAALSQQWELPTGAALTLSGALCIAVAAGGPNGVLTFNGLLVPLLLVLVLGLCVAQWFYLPSPPGVCPVDEPGRDLAPVTGWGAPENPPTPFWAVSALLYLSYNIIIVVAALVAAGSSSTCSTIQGCVVGLVIGGAGFATLTIIEPQVSSLVGLDIPLAFIAAGHGRWATHGYSVALVVALLTTAVAQVFGTASRLGSSRGSTPLVVVAVTCAALPVAAFGFTRLVAAVYPAMGIVGAAFGFSLLYSRFGARRIRG